jgi:hypothetical protein
MTQDSSEPKLQIDADWKAQAQAEKERLTRQEKEQARPRTDELPPADFRTLVGVLAHQAILGLGAVGDPKTGRIVVDLEGARFSIDLLDVLEQKTKGNLTPEEAAELKQVLAELRARYVQFAQLVARQSAAGGAAATAGEPKPAPPLKMPST